MLHKCLNPNCTAPFNFRQGRMFRFRQPASAHRTHSKGHGVKHFWLCLDCSQAYRVEFLKGRVRLVPKDDAARASPVSKNAEELVTA